MNKKLSPPLSSIPTDIISLADYERLAVNFIPHPVYEYIAAGVADDITLKRNRNAFDLITLNNRPLQSFDHASTSVSLLNHQFDTPIMLAPVAYQKLVHPDGELATAEAAAAMRTGFISSTLSSQSLENIAKKIDGHKWFQLYFQESREFTLSLLHRAEAAGYTAIVVTVDVPINGLRNRPQRAGFVLPDTVKAVNLLSKREAPPVELADGESIILNGIMRDATRWKDLEWLRQQTKLPILIKGITHPDDALKAARIGIDGIIVSNHGGRSLDGLPATITVLPAIRSALGNDFPLLLDSGIRRGTDIFKAIALGANAVLVGRPQVFALAVAGALGVAHMLRLLQEEFQVAMALSGCPTIDSINHHSIYNHHQL